VGTVTPGMILTTLAIFLLVAGCSGIERGRGDTPRIGIAHLGAADGDPRGLATIGEEFRSRNPGHDVAFFRDTTSLAKRPTPRTVFVQGGETRATVMGTSGERHSDLWVGDIIVLRPGESLSLADPISLVVFETNTPPPPSLPSFIRPDWDPRITDTPGGCATEEGAYRRILLTWREEVGPYIWHGVNAHRVRISDSFTHYHPLVGGFDEFYLVQMVQPGGRILTSAAVEAIESRQVDRRQASSLLRSDLLEVGDLVYLPRGLIHRGVGGVLAQVITFPGFRPGAEIGVDHHLRAISEALGLTGDEAIPYHQIASLEEVVK